MVITAIVERKSFEFEEMYMVGASMGYYEYSIIDGNYLFIIKYAAQDNEFRVEETD